MQYDPIKKSLGTVFNKQPFMRKIFYVLLDLILLRAWHIKKAIRNWKKTHINNAHILDAGSGFGQYSYFLSKQSPKWHITGVDVKTEQIEDCNNFFLKIGKSNQVKFRFADLTEYTNESAYDLILSVDVMEHIEEDVKVFKNFNDSLKPGGMLLISTPSDMGGSDVHGHSDHSFIEEHVRDGYNMNEIEEKLIKAGFGKVEVSYSYGKPGQLSWKLSMKWPILLLNFSRLFFIFLPIYYIVVFPISFWLNYFDTNSKHETGTGLIVKAYK
ncbi:MAG: methyltransferase type 11 [Bacteroidetes bacterium GWF2_33_16]|nr:MAG: methyltransferase type 11 [Bacteroidetes bacterium GWE2_32_14]OFY03328.1 MAG: methyltransferase type 11 [Bacteroidetes bacterium GWF2_33_16]